MLSAIALNKIDLDCAENVKYKTTDNGSGFIIYSDTISISINKQIENKNNHCHILVEKYVEGSYR